MTAGKPDAEVYRTKREQLQLLAALALTGHIELRFADETGFSLLPNVPYGWLPKGRQTGIPADNKRVMNVFGLMSLDQRLTAYPKKGHIDSAFIIKCMDDFSAKVKKPTVVVMDQAPWHTSMAVREQLERWERNNMFVFFLPRYSPHLNAIEILWRFIKYKWLKPKDYLSADSLRNAVFEIFKHFGKKYKVNFSMNFNLLQ